MGGTLQKMMHRPEDLKTAKGLRETADKLHGLWRDCKIAHAAGTTAGIAGGVLTIGGLTARAAKPLLLLGMSIGVAGAGTNLAASIVRSSTNSNVIKKAKKDSKETLQDIIDVNNTFQQCLDMKEGARLLYIGCLAVRVFNINVSAISLSAINLLLPALPLPATIVEVARKLALEAGKTSAVQAAKRAHAPGAKRARAVGARPAASAQGAAAATAGGKLAGRLIIGASPLFLVWDAIDLSIAIRDIVENKGPEEVQSLRQKADELDKENLNNSRRQQLEADLLVD